METPSQASKSCTRCGETKPLSEFYLMSYLRISGNVHKQQHPECKVCNRLRTRARYHSDQKASILAKDKIARQRRAIEMKALVFGAYGGYVCACCGETEKKFLSIDHINNDGAEFRRRIGGKRTAAGYHTYRWLVLNGFPEGFQVLCMNCNHGKRMNKGVCPHRSGCNDYPVEGVGASAPKCNATDPIYQWIG